MKMKYSFTIVLILLLKMAESQLVESSFPVAGKTAYYKIMYGAVFQNGPVLTTGSNYTWDFSSLQLSIYDTFQYLNPAQTPYAADFPSANIVNYRGFSNFRDFSSISAMNFLNKTTAAATLVGGVTYASVPTPIKYTYERPLKWLQFPFNYGNMFADTGVLVATAYGPSVGMAADSVHIKRTLFRADTLDGTGTVHLTFGSINNVYRNKATDYAVDSMWTYTNGSGWSFATRIVDTYQLITWLANDSNFIIAESGFRDDTMNFFYHIVPAIPQTQLRFQDLPAIYYEQKMLPSFTVQAQNLQGQQQNSFNDSVYISVNYPFFIFGPNGSSFNRMTAKANNGIARFDSITIGTSISQSGICTFVAIADTALPDTFSVAVSPLPFTTKFNSVQTSIAETQILPSFTVEVLNQSLQHDSVFADTIYIGKLRGPGRILGNTKSVATSGTASFNNVAFSYPGNYTILAYNNSIANADTIDINVQDLNNISWSFVRNDTLSEFLDRAQQFSWSDNLEGYTSGTSAHGAWKEISQRFDMNGSGQLKEIDLCVAQKRIVPPVWDSFYVKIYDASVQIKPDSFTYWTSLPKYCDRLPGTLLRKIPFYIADVTTGDYFNRKPTVIQVNPPLDIHADFIVSVETNPAGVDDTLVLWTSTPGDGHGEHRAAKFTKDYQHQGLYAWKPDYLPGPDPDVDLMIQAVVAYDTVNIDTSFNGMPRAFLQKPKVFPNPASHYINIMSFDNQLIMNLEIISLDGQRVLTKELKSFPSDALSRVDVSGLANGIYMLRLQSGTVVETYKCVINH